MKTSKFQYWSAVCGIAGCGAMLLGVALAISGYTGPFRETYSMGNHFISELGNRRFTPAAGYFNYAMIGSSTMLTLFAFGLTSRFSGWRRILLLILALITSISCAFVGIFPMDNLAPHLLAAMVFFHSALALVLACSGIVLFSKAHSFPKWTALFGLLTALIFAAFVLWPSDLVREWARDPVHFARPEFWWHPVLEWACFFSIILWIAIMAFLLRRKA